MTNQEPVVPEPLTEAGRRLLYDWDWPTRDDEKRAHTAILAIEQEAAGPGEYGEALNGIVAALSHPESDTRGLDAAIRETLFEFGYDFPPDQPPRIAARIRELAGTSPDLSIDREGLTVETLAAALDKARVELPEPRRGEPGGTPLRQRQAREVLAAIRGTTQPEPTE